LVERVPLVFQQANVILSNCDVVIEQMCGEMDVDNWSERKWKQIFEDSDVCVMTAQIFLDCLYHGFLSLEKVIHLLFSSIKITFIQVSSIFFLGSLANF
jgi:endoribonuclease Dicer